MSIDQSLLERIGQISQELAPHFDSVLILCTYRDNNGMTKAQIADIGNTYASHEVARCYCNDEIVIFGDEDGE